MFNLTRSAMDAGGRSADVHWKVAHGCEGYAYPRAREERSVRRGSAEDEPTRGIAAGIAKGHTRTRGRAGEDKNAPRRGRNYLTRAYKLLSEIRIKIEHQQSWHRLPIQLGPERSSVFFFQLPQL